MKRIIIAATLLFSSASLAQPTASDDNLQKLQKLAHEIGGADGRFRLCGAYIRAFDKYLHDVTAYGGCHLSQDQRLEIEKIRSDEEFRTKEEAYDRGFTCLSRNEIAKQQDAALSAIQALPAPSCQ